MKMLILSFVIAALLQIKNNQPEVVIENEKENVLTMGIENPLKALAENTSKKEIVLTTNNGTIQKLESNRFLIIPAKIGIALINVCKIVKKDTIVIGTREFRVHKLPDPVAIIGNFTGGPIKKNLLLNFRGVIAKINCCGFDYPVQISGYTLVALRDNITIGTASTVGPLYSDKCVELLNQLQTNDHLIICSLVAKLSVQDSRILHPMEFIIEE